MACSSFLARISLSPLMSLPYTHAPPRGRGRVNRAQIHQEQGLLRQKADSQAKPAMGYPCCCASDSLLRIEAPLTGRPGSAASCLSTWAPGDKTILFQQCKGCGTN